MAGAELGPSMSPEENTNETSGLQRPDKLPLDMGRIARLGSAVEVTLGDGNDHNDYDDQTKFPDPGDED